jgi:hypothetical protein
MDTQVLAKLTDPDSARLSTHVALGSTSWNSREAIAHGYPRAALGVPAELFKAGDRTVGVGRVERLVALDAASRGQGEGDVEILERPASR